MTKSVNNTSRSQSVESSVLSNSTHLRNKSHSSSESEDVLTENGNFDSEEDRLLDEAAEILNQRRRNGSVNITSSEQSCVSSKHSRIQSPMLNVDGNSSADDFFGDLKEKMLHLKNKNEVNF